jgi:hypothetical protein
MAGIAKDVRRALPITGLVFLMWVILWVLWRASLQWATSRTGRLAPLAIVESLVFMVAMAAVIAFVWGVLLLISRRRDRAIVFLLSALAVLATGPVLGPFVHQFRHQRFREFAERSRPLVAAIQSYERDNGHPPNALETLVPAYLPETPTTGMGAFPAYLYSTECRSSRWCLTVPVAATPLQWEALRYAPSQDCARGTIRFDGWVLDVG